MFCVFFIGFFDGFVGLVVGVLDVGGLYRIGWDWMTDGVIGLIIGIGVFGIGVRGIGVLGIVFGGLLIEIGRGVMLRGGIVLGSLEFG